MPTTPTTSGAPTYDSLYQSIFSGIQGDVQRQVAAMPSYYTPEMGGQPIGPKAQAALAGQLATQALPGMLSAYQANPASGQNYTITGKYGGGTGYLQGNFGGKTFTDYFRANQPMSLAQYNENPYTASNAPHAPGDSVGGLNTAAGAAQLLAQTGDDRARAAYAASGPQQAMAMQGAMAQVQANPSSVPQPTTTTTVNGVPQGTTAASPTTGMTAPQQTASPYAPVTPLSAAQSAQSYLNILGGYQGGMAQGQNNAYAGWGSAEWGGVR